MKVPLAPSTPASREAVARSLAFAICVLFVIEGWIFIPYPGIQNDEVLFAAGIYQPRKEEYTISVFHRGVPVMIMSYIGGLKTWIYKVLFWVWAPSQYSVRVPVLLIGAVTVWLLFLLMLRTVGARAALAGAALLATDTTFLLTTTFDWGPVAIQHLLLAGGVLLVWLFHSSGRRLYLAAGFFALGLGLWDKALFIWILVGLGAAAVIVFPGALRRHLTRRNAVTAVLAFLLGAAPLIVYNVKTGWKTFSGNARFSAERLKDKLRLLEATFEGSSLIGYIVREEPAPGPAAVSRSPLARASLAVSRAAGQPGTGPFLVAFGLATLLLPWLWRSAEGRAMRFALVFLAVTWAQMAFTKEAGHGTHHAVLLWPFPHFYVGAAFAGAARRLGRAGVVVLVVVLAVVCGWSLLVTNQHLALLVANGPGPVWTDAIHPLAAYLGALPAKNVFSMDWGTYDPLRATNRGRLPLVVGSDPFMRETMTDEDRLYFEWMLAQPESVYVGHTEGNEVFAGVAARSQAAFAARGYRKERLQLIEDRYGRPMFEVYRFVRQ